MKSILVIGLGRFGTYMAKKFSELGNHVLVLDTDEEKINEILPYVTSAQIGDATKPAVLDALEDAGGFLPLNAKSDLAAIRDYFSFSKRVFKQVIGMLYKEGRITIAEDGIRLNPPQEEKQP